MAVIIITVMTCVNMIVNSTERHLHNYFGIVIMALALLLFVQGLIISVTSMFCDLHWKKDFTRKIRVAHKYVGIVTIVIALVTVMTGIVAYAYKSNWDDLQMAGPLNLGLALITLLVVEVFYRIWRKKETPWKIPEAKMSSD